VTARAGRVAVAVRGPRYPVTRAASKTGAVTYARDTDAVAGFKNAMAELVSGVSLLTVRVEDPPLDLGMTVTSLASASLEPPMVAVGIGRGTSLAPYLVPRAHVGITVLAEHQGELAAEFSLKGRPSAQEILAGRPHRRGPVTGALVAEDALAVMEGLVEQTIAAGDHLIVLIAIVGTAIGPGTEPALLYQRRGYGHAKR
jgi:flavin reductase (DIM6/NTAB) family NADH-FMN oxidoreductase RutF